MKTQLFIIITSVILFSANVSLAAVVYFNTDDPMVKPGETISISIFSTEETGSIRMDRISDADFGEASNLYLNPNYNGIIVGEGIVVNSDGVLIEDIEVIELPAWPAVSGVLYSFDYLVPMATLGHTITIFADPSNGAINQVHVGGDIWDYITPESLTLTVVPEPGTILLLGIGSFLFARKK